MKKKSNIFLNILLGIVLTSSISYFVITLFNRENSINFIISLISSLLLFIFACFFVITESTNPTKKKAKIYGSVFLFLLYLAFVITNSLNLLPTSKLGTVEDFTNKSLTEVIKWSEKNHIEIDQVYEYSDLVDEYHIISQSKNSNTTLKNLKKLTVVVSEGPNPYKEVIVPNMNTWTSKKVLEFIEKNNLSNVDISFVESDKIKNTLIEQSTSGTMKRCDELKLTFSSGDNEKEDVTLIDLSNKTKLEAIFFLKENGIDYDLESDFSSSIKREKVIKTDPKEGTVFKKDDENRHLKLIISKGEKIKVPDLKNYSMSKITEWVIKNKLRLEFTDKYDDNIKENKVISANYSKGDVIEEKTTIKIVISKGKLLMQSFDSLDEFKDWANKYGVNYEEKYVFNSEVESGKVISYSHKKGDTIKNDDTVIVTISQGEKTTVPNVVGKSKEDAIKLLEKAKLKYNFVYEASTKDKNIVLKQSLSANSEISKNTTITITLSNGKKPTTTTNNSNSNRNNSNNNTNNGGNSNNNNSGNTTPSTPTCDKSVTEIVFIYDELLADSASATCSNIKKAYPNLKFSCSYKTGTGMSSGLLINSSSIDNHSFNRCDTISLEISQN